MSNNEKYWISKVRFSDLKTPFNRTKVERIMLINPNSKLLFRYKNREMPATLTAGLAKVLSGISNDLSYMIACVQQDRQEPNTLHFWRSIEEMPLSWRRVIPEPTYTQVFGLKAKQKPITKHRTELVTCLKKLDKLVQSDIKKLSK